MTGAVDPENIIYLRPTAEDMQKLAAVDTPLAEYFRPSDAYPLKFPDLKLGEHLVFDFDYDSSETGKVERTFAVVETHEQMAQYCAAVRHNIIGVIGWRVIAEPEVQS